MFEDSDRETSDLEIESRTWKKLENNLKSVGFREGSSQGKDTALQQGFNLGYLDGFKIGEHVGLLRGILSCQSELDVTTEDKKLNERELESVSSKSCILCLKVKKYKSLCSEKIPLEKLQDIILQQQIQSAHIIRSLKSSEFVKT